MHELEELTGPELRQLLAGGATTVVVPFGSIEYHGGHLPVGTDSLLADAIGREVAHRLGAVLMPTQRVGDADTHVDRDGTLTLGAATLTNVAVMITRGLARQGFRIVVLLSTHGGNGPALSAAKQGLACELPDETQVLAPTGDVGPHPGSHSGEWITSVMLALHPDLVQLDQAGGSLMHELSAASAERGRDHLERFVARVMREITEATQPG